MELTRPIDCTAIVPPVRGSFKSLVLARTAYGEICETREIDPVFSPRDEQSPGIGDRSGVNAPGPALDYWDLSVVRKHSLMGCGSQAATEDFGAVLDEACSGRHPVPDVRQAATY